MAKQTARSDESLKERLPQLLLERGMSIRALARAVGVNQSHLSRVLGAEGSRPASRELAAALATALDLPTDYFPEFRRGVVIEALDADQHLRDRIYDSIKRGLPKR